MRVISKSSSTSAIEVHGFYRQEKTGTKIIPRSVVSTNNKKQIHKSSSTLCVPPKMSGDIRKPRKLWSLQDRSSLNVDLLKANLADDGDEECQLDMAKKLLAESNELDSPSSKRENARLAIYWLIKSGDQGNEEATSMLHQCLKSGQGITCQNISDVRSCVGTPKNDKLVFKAARLLYEKLCNGEEFITTTQILRWLTSPKSKSCPNSSSAQESSSLYNEDTLNTTFTLDEDASEDDVSGNSNSFDSNASSKKQLMEQNDAVKLTRSDLLKLASDYNNGEIPHVAINCHTRQNQHYNWNLLSLSHAFLVQFLLLSLVTKAMTLHSVFLVIISLLTLWTAFHFFMWRNKIVIFEEWTTAFKSVLQNNALNHMTSRKKLRARWIRPLTLTNIGCLYLLYLLACPSLVNFVLSAITIVSIFRGIFSENLTWSTRAIIATTIVSSKSFANYQEEIFTQLSTYVKDLLPLSFFDLIDIGTGLLPQDYYYFEEWKVPVLSVQLVFVIVNLVIISTCFLCTNEKTEITPVFEQLILLSHLIKLDDAVFAMNINELYFAIGVSSIVLVFFYLLEQNKDLWKIIFATVLTTIIVFVSVLTVVMISSSNTLTKNVNGSPAVQRITWDEYNAMCHRKAWKEKTVPETQIKCSLKYAFKPTFVTSWSGRISNIKISHVSKKQFSQLKSKSTADDEEIITIDGITFEMLVNIENPSGTDDDGGRSWQTLLTGTKEKELNIVLLSISTKGIIGYKEKVKATRRLLQYRVGDLIEFHGQLLKGFGGLKPEIGKISSLKCIDCTKTESGEEFSFTNESFTLDILYPFEEYIGSELISFMGELEAWISSQLE